MNGRTPDSRIVVNIINITNTCQAFSTLPREGGLLDQDCFLVLSMQLVLEAQGMKQQREMEKAKNAPRST